jgi:hypothetical protein
LRRADHVAKTIKGLLVALVAALALELTDDPGAAALGLIGTVAAVLAGNVYADFVEADIASGRRLGPRDVAGLTWHSVGIGAGAVPAFVLFVLAWLGVIAVLTAIDVAIWSGIALLLLLGYLSGRLRGDDRLHAALHGTLLALVGIGVLALKSIH